MHFQNYITYGQNSSPFKGYEIKRKKHEVNSLMIWFLLHQLIDLNHLLNPSVYFSVMVENNVFDGLSAKTIKDK